MNRQEVDVLNAVYEGRCMNQREIAQKSGHSLGIVNRSIKTLINDGYIDVDLQITTKGKSEFEKAKPQNAIILAAGYGMRMVPINTEVSKGLIEVDGEPLVERLIKQLHEAGIYEIYVVVGFLKEHYEYLIDEYQVKLVVNSQYKEKNNLYSLKKVEKYFGNSYIVPCDLWCAINPFRKNEFYSWYMVNEIMDENSTVRVNRKMELVASSNGGNGMVGISYIAKPEAGYIKERMAEFITQKEYDNAFWEECLWDEDKMIVQARVVSSSEVIEINTFEQLRDLDEQSSQLESEAIHVITEVLQADVEDITDITVLKKGMTNRSFLFSCKNDKYIMRIPGEGTDMLINRKEEADVYQVICDRGICDNVIYINPENGYKITRYLEHSRVCDMLSQDDLIRSMDKLREFHKMGLKVEHEFDIFERINFYESLWRGRSSVYRDYNKTKENIYRLKTYIEEQPITKSLTHIDAVPDNFLFVRDNYGKEEVQLIDWEYAAMQDPHVDIAMFCIYSLYDRQQIDNLIDIYFEGVCDEATRTKIYAYIAACGLVWSNWCEYKRHLGVEFGEYSLRQYRYAKEYYRLVQERLDK